MTKRRPGVKHTRSIITLRNIYTHREYRVCDRCYADDALIHDKLGDCEVVAGATYHGRNHAGCEL